MVSKEKNPLLEKYNFEEEFDEERDGLWLYTGYPKPTKRYRLSIEDFNLSMEETYYWILNQLKDLGTPMFDKIIDVFSASENSSMFGVWQQRLGSIQDRASQYLRGISELVRTLFQQVRELRIIDERLALYNNSWSKDKKVRDPAEITLKGIWIDLVEGGAKNPASVYGYARELGFATLPDLFFAAPPLKIEQINDYVESIDVNRKVKEVLKRKLNSFITWKEATYKELNNRRSFAIKYLRQHYNTIKLYMDWVKPYLRSIRRLHMQQSRNESVDIVGAFESSMIEIEYLAKTIPIGNKKYYGVLLMNFLYYTKPSLGFVGEGYQRGPIHVGKVDITWRTYAWTEEEIENYKKFKDEESLQMLSDVDSTLKESLESLEEDLKRYLTEEGEKFPEKEEKKEEAEEKPAYSAFEPFTSVVKGFGELGSALFGVREWNLFKKNEAEEDKEEISKEKSKAEAAARFLAWQSYKNYKKSHGILAW